MSDPADARVIKVKVKPYPFEGTIEHNGVKKQLKVIYINQKGLIASLAKQFVMVGDRYQITFELPVLSEYISTPVRVMKTYDKPLEAKAQQVERVAEFQFEKLTEEHKARIVSFITAIKQAK